MSFNPRIHLRAFEVEDLDTVVRWVNNEAVTSHLSDALIYPVSKADEIKWLESVSMANPREKVFAIETSSGRLIGSVGLREVNWVERKAELGIMIGETDCWGQGYGTAAVLEVLRIAFEKMNLNRVWLRVYENNTRAIRVYEKCGFRQEGVLREDHCSGGAYYNTLIMGILKREYLAVPQPSGS
jgi:RimJ/RimL family protein N-acetyltransferase